jgi:gliding motility-associated protein GldL
MATEKAKKLNFGAKFMHWYESYQGKNVVNIIYSAGASVVIIGALFKILHWPGASQVLMLGMFTEAFLFLIGTLERPHAEFHWENVFPQLLEYGANPELLEEKSRQARPNLLGAGIEGGPQPQGGTVAPTGQTTTAPTPKAPMLKEEDFKALKSGIEDLAKTASQLSELGKVAQSGVKLNEKLQAAEAATDTYAAATSDLSKRYAQVSGELEHVSDEVKNVASEMQNVTANTRAYNKGVEQVGQNIASLNSVYELQLQALNDQIAAQKQVASATNDVIAATKDVVATTKNVVSATNDVVSATKASEAAVKDTIAAAKEAAEAQAAFAKGTQQLTKQVSELNSIYGNMLNALA